MSCHSWKIWLAVFLLRDQMLTIWGFPCMLFIVFPLLLLIFFSLYLIFDSLINMCLGVFLLRFLLYGILCTSWAWLTISFPTLGKFSTIISSNIFSVSFFFSSSSGSCIIRVLVHLMLSQKSLRLSHSFHSFFFILLCGSYFQYFIFQVTYPFSASVILLLIPSWEFLISFIVLFLIVCSLILVGPCLTFLVFSPFYFQDFWSSLLSLPWILFQVDCLFHLHLFGLLGFYLAPSSAVCFCVFSFCLTYCVWGLLFSGCSFVVPFVFGVCPYWARLVQWVV